MGIDVREELSQRLGCPEHRKAFGAEDYKAEIARLIFETRKAEGLTQEQFGKLLGVSQPYIARLERGDANPTIGMVGRMFAVFCLRVRSRTEEFERPPSKRKMVAPNITIRVSKKRPSRKQWAMGLELAKKYKWRI